MWMFNDQAVRRKLRRVGTSDECIENGRIHVKLLHPKGFPVEFQRRFQIGHRSIEAITLTHDDLECVHFVYSLWRSWLARVEAGEANSNINPDGAMFAVSVLGFVPHLNVLGVSTREAFVKISSRSHVSQHDPLIFPIDHQPKPVTAKTYAAKQFVFRQPNNLVNVGRIEDSFRVFIVPRHDSPLVLLGDLSNCPLE
uniref:Uncharacterized protein n=1 Tax=Candidatus Kentrum sp. DK TaxID=2126562 RepID=A0A450T9G8_9GAMM|nr:MAG: hypothetical protein BECKDK2373C_GA0170839_110616 [Candidatus Kentron sp. DK]